jgi:hypothetical protein
MLTAETILHRVPELVVEVDTSNLVRVHHEGRVLKLGPEALSLLDVLHQPMPVAEALRRVAHRLAGRRATEQVLRTMTMLVNAGVLNTEAVRGFCELPFPMGGYDSAFAHLMILNDTVRKGAFVRAVREVVEPGDVVLDLGTGSGILAVAAAQAGARRVYAVEPAGMVHLAEQVAEHNGVADRITFIRGWSSQLTLPERANVLTTDIIGNEALDMVIWETIQDARERLLTEDPRLVPAVLDGFAQLVEVPPDVLCKHRADAAQVDHWRLAYGMDFTPLLRAEAGRPVGFYERPEVVQEWPVLGKPAPLYQIDLSTPVGPVDVQRTVAADRCGLATGVVVFFEARLSPHTTLCTAPWEASGKSHWYTAVWALPEPVTVDPGSSLDVHFRYLGEGRSRLEPVPAFADNKEMSA